MPTHLLLSCIARFRFFLKMKNQLWMGSAVTTEGSPVRKFFSSTNHTHLEGNLTAFSSTFPPAGFSPFNVFPVSSTSCCVSFFPSFYQLHLTFLTLARHCGPISFIRPLGILPVFPVASPGLFSESFTPDNSVTPEVGVIKNQAGYSKNSEICVWSL